MTLVTVLVWRKLHSIGRYAAEGLMRGQRVAVGFGGLLVLAGLAVAMMETTPRAAAVPSYARQTGLPCSGCHTTPPELNAAGRRFKLLGYVDRGEDTKSVKDSSNKQIGRAHV